ncbi:hypothetical protein LguiA_008069 [Lonicera macranthoides]
MAIIKTHEASSSDRYDVFLSFRGKDTRKSFTDHLYTALVQQGFRTFRDDDEAERGENLKSELEKAIRQSKISIIVISKDYASSTWCLDELVMILEQRRNYGHVVLPVFYDVDPSQVRKQTGRTAEAFARYEKQFEEQTDQDKKTEVMKKIKGWRSALTEIADVIGFDLPNQVDGHEAKFIKKIIKVIRAKLRSATLDVAPYSEVGIDSRAKLINLWLQDGSHDVSIRAICGMGGIGKSTIAKFVYNQNSSSFDGSSFLADIRDVSEQPNGLTRLQRQLISDISRKKQGKIYNVDEGLVQIKNVICGKRVLLVLDDVEQENHIYVVLGMRDWLFSGSKVIITTRHERLLEPHQIFRVKNLGQDESIKLFSLHAFGDHCPIKSYTEHTKRAVQICDGLPLALKVVGSSLFRKNEDEWVSQLAKLEAIPHSQILRKLKLSYDSLEDDHDKRLFIHIACFFVGIDKDYTIKILEKCGLHAKIGIQNLINQCLLERDNGGVLRMHRLIQEVGRQIVYEESHEAGERSRVWHNGDAFNVLKNETGTKTVEGLTLDMRMSKEARSNAKKRRYEEFCDKSILSKHVNSLKRCFNFVSGKSISTTLRSSNDMYLRTDAFKNMSKLRLLKLNYVELTGSYENFPKSLAWLSWHGFPLKSIPIEFPLEKIVALDLRHSRLEQVWKDTPFLGSLKILDLSYSECLARTPNFLGLPNLERLILKGCVSLVEICESIGELEMLDLLDLKDCKTLTNLPRNIGKLGSLKTLIISGCNIGELPIEMRNMKSLEVLNADRTTINPSHSSSGKVKWWPLIVCSMVSTPRKGPETLWASLPFSLKELSLCGCNLFDDSFPENFSNLQSLGYLNLRNNPFQRLPNCFRDIQSLRFLDITNCHGLQTLDFNCLRKGFGFVNAKDCRSLEKITSLNSIASLNVVGCYKLVDIEDYLKKEPTGKFNDTEISNYLGINKLMENQEQVWAQILELSIPSGRWQRWGTFEFGIFSRYFGVGEFPMFSQEKIKGSVLYFTVPSLSPQRIQCLNVFCTYGSPENDDAVVVAPRARIREVGGKFGIAVKIENKTKDHTWIYIPRLFCCPNYEIVEWLSKWRFGNQMEAGDEIIFTFDCSYENYKVKENGTTTIEKSRHDFPAFRLSSGAYFLCQNFEAYLNEDYLSPKENNIRH